MPKYTVQDSQSGKKITFEWTGEKPPTQADMQDVFAAARGQAMSPQPETGEPPAPQQGGSSEMPSLGGGVVGGLLTATRRTPWGMAASGLGGAGAEAWYQVYQHLTGNPNAPQTTTDALKRVGKAGLTQAGGELVGRGIFKGIEKAFSPFKKNVIPEVEKANDTFKNIMKARAETEPAFENISKVVGFTPAQRSTHKLVDTLEEIGEKSFTGGERMRRYRELQNASFKQVSDDLIADYGQYLTKEATPEEVGLVFQNAYAARDSVYRRLARIKYGKVDRLAGQGKVSLSGLKEEAKRLIETAEKRRGIGSTTAKDALLEKVLKLDDTVTFNEAQAIRSGLMDEISTMSASSDIGRGMAKNFQKLVDSSMEESAKTLSPDAYKAWREANMFYRGYKTKFGNDFMQSLVKVADKAPEKVVDKVFQNGAVTQIRNVKDIVPPRTFETLKAAYLQKIMQESINGGDVIIGKTLKHKLKAMGQPTLKEIFTPQELQRIYNVVTVGETLQKPIGSGGGMLVQLMQASGAVGMLTGSAMDRPGVTASSAMVFFGPNMLSRMMLNPATSRYLLQGFRTPAKSKEALTISSKILASVAKSQMEEKKRMESE